MPKAKLSEAQEEVLKVVVATAPHSTLVSISRATSRSLSTCGMAINALIRRGFVTATESWQDGEVFVATPKGRRR